MKKTGFIMTKNAEDLKGLTRVDVTKKKKDFFNRKVSTTQDFFSSLLPFSYLLSLKKRVRINRFKDLDLFYAGTSNSVTKNDDYDVLFFFIQSTNANHLD